VRKSTVFIAVTAVNLTLCVILLVHSRLSRGKAAPTLMANAELVGKLQLTDLCLFTEARYTRHPSMADSFAPFQDHPLALEHFPSGSLLSPSRPARCCLPPFAARRHE